MDLSELPEWAQEKIINTALGLLEYPGATAKEVFGGTSESYELTVGKYTYYVSKHVNYVY